MIKSQFGCFSDPRVLYVFKFRWKIMRGLAYSWFLAGTLRFGRWWLAETGIYRIPEETEDVGWISWISNHRHTDDWHCRNVFKSARYKIKGPYIQLTLLLTYFTYPISIRRSSLY